MQESFRTRLLRIWQNHHPAYWSTGAKLTDFAGDFRKVRLRLPLTWRTRDVVGTLFGVSMFGVLDPVCMLMQMRNLGAEDDALQQQHDLEGPFECRSGALAAA